MRNKRYRMPLSIVSTALVLSCTTYFIISRRINIQHSFFILLGFCLLSYLIQYIVFFILSSLFCHDNNEPSEATLLNSQSTKNNDFSELKTSSLIVLSHLIFCMTGAMVFLILQKKSVIESYVAKVFIANFIGIFVVLFVAEVLISIIVYHNTPIYHYTDNIAEVNHHNSNNPPSTDYLPANAKDMNLNFNSHADSSNNHQEPPPSYEEAIQQAPVFHVQYGLSSTLVSPSAPSLY